MDTLREQFLAGERPEDVLCFLAGDAVSDLGTLVEHGERVADGVALVLDGERGRSAFENVAGVDPMALAGAAMDVEGHVSLVDFAGECPEADGGGVATENGTAAGEGAATAKGTVDGGATDDEEHAPRFVFAFAEAQNPEVGGLYAEGDVLHAYAVCECGTAYSDRWVAGER
jgi:hypothetical protein